MARERPSRTMPPVLWAYLFYGFFLAIPLVAVALWLGARIPHELHALARARGAPSSTAPALIEGEIQAGEPMRSPLGAEVAGWSGLVFSKLRHGKTTTEATLCTFHEVAAIRLGGQRVRLEEERLLPVAGAFDMLNRIDAQGPRADLLLGEIDSSPVIPEAYATRCKLPALREGESRTWIEHRFVPGQRATFFGCATADGLGPCTQGRANVMLVAGSRNELLARLLGTGLLGAAGLLTIALFFSFVATFTVRKHLRLQLARMPARPGDAWPDEDEQDAPISSDGRRPEVP
jgi:hypothetical protein